MHPSSSSSRRYPPRHILLHVLICLVFAAIPSLAQQQQQQCTPVPYRGLCTSLGVTYPTSNPQSAITDRSLTQILSSSNMIDIGIVDYTCARGIQQLVCAQAYPHCAVGNTTMTTGKEQRVCKSSCRRVRESCLGVLERAGVTNLILPGCEGVMDPAFNRTTAFVDDATLPGGTTATCLNTANLMDSKNATCTWPFIPNPYWPQQTGPPTCNGPCCAPCPIEQFFRPPGIYDLHVHIHHILHLVAFFLSLYVLVSYAVLPGRRQHPADIVLHFLVGIVLWASVGFYVIVNPRNMQCAADGVTPSTAANNTLCAVQGTMLLFAVHGTIMWGAYMIFNLHLTIVHHSDILRRYKRYGILICWGIPIALAFTALATNNIDASSGAVCFITKSAALPLFFITQIVFLAPAFLAQLWTFIYILRTAKDPSTLSSSSSSSSSSSGGGEDGYESDASFELRKSGSQGPTFNNRPGSSSSKRSTRHRQFIQLVKLNWRALLLGLIFCINSILYAAFYVHLYTAKANFGYNSPSARAFIKCIITALPITSAQDTCVAKFSDQIPPGSLVVATYIMTGTIGIWAFIIFGAQTALLRDWKRYLGRG